MRSRPPAGFDASHSARRFVPADVIVGCAAGVQRDRRSRWPIASPYRRLPGLANVPVNVTDRPELSSFIVPAIVDRDPIVIADLVRRYGADPCPRPCGRKSKARCPWRGWVLLARFAAGFRKAAQGLLADPAAARRQFCKERFFTSSVAETGFLPATKRAARAARCCRCSTAPPTRLAPGVVYLGRCSVRARCRFADLPRPAPDAAS